MTLPGANTPSQTDQQPVSSATQPIPPQTRVVLKPEAKKPVVTFVILGLTIAIFIAQLVLEKLLGVDLLFVYLGKVNELILRGQLWRLITPALLHSNILHIAFNMYALYIFGTRLEPVYGHVRFLLLYLLAAFGGNVLSFVLSPSPSLGSSTAIFGLLAAEGVLVWHNREYFGPNTRNMLLNLGMVLAVNLMIGLNPTARIDNFGHLGGLLAGFIFSAMAGPKWKVGRGEAGFFLKDNRLKQDAFIAALIVFAGFALMAAIPFLQ